MPDLDELQQQPNEEQEELESSEQNPEPSEEPEEEEQLEQEEEQEEEQQEEEEEETRKPSRREQLRIAQVLEKLKQQPQRPETPKTGVDYRELIDADEEVYQQLDEKTRSYGQDLYTQGLKQAESIQFHTRLEIDAPKVEAKYPQLNKDSDEFNPAVAAAINNMYLSAVGYDPQTGHVQNSGVRYAEYIDSFMELVDATAGEKVQRTSKNIAKQAATTGLRPDGSSAKRLNLNQAPEAMSDEELDAIIAATLPKK